MLGKYVALTGTSFNARMCVSPLRTNAWEAVTGLQPGDRVQVIDKAGTTYNGSLLSVSGEAIRVMSGKTRSTSSAARCGG